MTALYLTEVRTHVSRCERLTTSQPFATQLLLMDDDDNFSFLDIPIFALHHQIKRHAMKDQVCVLHIVVSAFDIP